MSRIVAGLWRRAIVPQRRLKFLDFRQHAAEYFEPEVFLVAQPVSPALNHTDLVVESFDKAQRHFIFRLAVSSDTIPMGVDHLSEVLVRLQALPLKLIAPVLKEFPCPGFPVVVPKLAKGLLQHVSGIEPLVGGQQDLEVLSSAALQVLLVGKECTLLAFDELAFFPIKLGVFLLSYLVERVSQMTQDVELIEWNGS